MEERISHPRYSVRPSVLVVLLGAAMVAVSVMLLPEDRSLGSATRWIFFHGALVWTAIVWAVVTALSGTANLADGSSVRRSGPRRRLAGAMGRSLTLTTALWALSLSLSFPIMSMTWGGILWREPRLLMSFTVTSVFLVLWAVWFVLEKPRLSALLCAAGGLLTVVMVATITSNFHPDSPVFSSGDVRFIGGFLTILAGLIAIEAAVVFGFGRDEPKTIQMGLYLV